MLVVTFHHNLDEKVPALQRLPFLFKDARRSGLSSVGFFITGEIRAWIESEGQGAWPGRHPLTISFSKKYGAPGRGWRKQGQKKAFFWLGKFSRYFVSGSMSENRATFGFSKDTKGGPFSEQFGEVMTRVERGAEIPVTGKMRKLLGATRPSGRGQTPGMTYFPLRKSTNILTMPPRPIAVPVFAQTRGRVPALFEEKFSKALAKRYEKL